MFLIFSNFILMLILKLLVEVLKNRHSFDSHSKHSAAAETSTIVITHVKSMSLIMSYKQTLDARRTYNKMHDLI